MQREDKLDSVFERERERDVCVFLIYNSKGRFHLNTNLDSCVRGKRRDLLNQQDLV